MIILGDKLIPFEDICAIATQEDIAATKANATLLFAYDTTLMHYCMQNSLSYAVVVKSLREAIYANALKAKYIVAQAPLAEKIQPLAENYMYDAKILAIIKSNDEFEAIAKKEIDGVIYNTLLEKGMY